jgi:hypothetical protein
VAPIVSPARGSWTLDWATGSILLSVAGAALSLFDPRLFAVGALLFAAGLVVGIVALRKGGRRNRAIIGVLLNAANLVYDAAVVVLSRTT